MINRTIILLVKRRKIFFLSTLLLMLLTSFLVSFPSFDGNILGFDLSENEYYQTALRIDSLFGTQKRIYIKVSPSSDNLKEVFPGVQDLEMSLKEKFPGVNVISLRHFYYRMFYKPENANSSLSSFLNQASLFPIMNDLISNDKKSFLIVMTSDSIGKFDMNKFNSVINRSYAGIEHIKAISLFHVENTIEEYIRKDFVVLSLVIIGFFILFFLYTFKKFSAILFTASITGISVFSSIFFFSIFHFHLNIVTILVIPVVLVLALSHSIHLLTGYVSFADIPDKGERIKKVINHYIIPSFFSSATTSAAFLTFYFFNDSEFIREFGLITALCLMAEFFLTFLIAPYLLELVNMKKINDRVIIGVGNFLEKKQKVFSVIFILVFISSFFFVHKLNFNTSSDMFFPKGSELYSTHEEFNKDFYSQVKLDVLLERKNKNRSSDTSENRKLESVVTSLTEYFRNTKKAARVNSATDNYYIESVLGTSVNFLENLGRRNPYYNKENNIYRIEVKVDNAEVVKEFAYKVLPMVVQKYPDYRISFTSPAVIMDYVNKRVSGSLVNSLLTSGLSIILMIFFLTRSISITLASLLPNLVPLSIIVFIYIFGGLEINILTAITAVVCLGLLDDDTIHILYRRLWLKEPLEELSFSIVSTSILLTAGFGMFYLSSFRPTQVFGVVSALVFLFGVICELTLMPWIINFWMKNKANKK